MRRDQAPSYSTAAAHKALQRTLNLLSERRFSRHLFPAAQRCIPPDGSSENREPGPAEWDPKDRTLWRHTDSRTRRSQRAGIRRAGQKAPAVTRRCRCLTDERAGRRETPGPARTAGNSGAAQGAVCGIRQRNGRLGGVSGGALRAFGTAGQAVLLGHLGCGTGRRVGRRR